MSTPGTARCCATCGHHVAFVDSTRDMLTRSTVARFVCISGHSTYESILDVVTLTATSTSTFDWSHVMASTIGTLGTALHGPTLSNLTAASGVHDSVLYQDTEAAPPNYDLAPLEDETDGKGGGFQWK